MNIMEILGKTFQGKKTYIASIAAVLTAIATFLMGETTVFETISLIIGAVFGSTFRSAFAVFFAAMQAKDAAETTAE